MWRSAMANRALISQGLAAGPGGSRTVGNRSDGVQVRPTPLAGSRAGVVAGGKLV